MATLAYSIHEQKALTSAQQATIQIPVYGTIQECFLRFTTAAGADATEAQVRSEIGNIRLTINGNDIINCSADKLYDLYEAMGSNVSTPAGINGNIELNVGRLLYIDPVARDVMGWGEVGVANIQVQITAGTLTNVASVTAITGRDSSKRVFGAHCRFINYPQSFNATGDHTVDTLPRDLDASYLAVLTDDGASGAITFGECRVNNQTVIQRLPSNTNALALSNKKMAQPPGYFVYNFTDGTLGGRLPMPGVTDLRFVTTFGTAPGTAGYNMTVLSAYKLPTQ